MLTSGFFSGFYHSAGYWDTCIDCIPLAEVLWINRSLRWPEAITECAHNTKRGWSANWSWISMSQQATLNLSEHPLLTQCVRLSRHPHHRLPSGQKWEMDPCLPAAYRKKFIAITSARQILLTNAPRHIWRSHPSPLSYFATGLLLHWTCNSGMIAPMKVIRRRGVARELRIREQQRLNKSVSSFFNWPGTFGTECNKQSQFSIPFVQYSCSFWRLMC